MEPQVILITGASRGLGRLFAETLARKGFWVWSSMRDPTGRNIQSASQLSELARRERLLIDVIDIDVTDDRSVEAGIRQVHAAAGRLDVVVNNAGVGNHGLTETYTLDQVRTIFDVNLFSIIRVNREALPYMRRARAGLLVHISSIAGRVAVPFMSLYSATKHALEALAEGYRSELGPLGIDSAILELGGYPTGILDSTLKGSDHQRISDYGQLGRIPRLMLERSHAKLSHPNAPRPAEVGEAIAQLIGMAPGTRPLRTLVGAEAQALRPLNDFSARLRELILQTLRLDDVVKFRTGSHI